MTAPRTPRTPQDRKPKQSEILAAEAAAEKPAGADLMKLAELPAWDQTEILATLTETFQAMGIDIDKATEVELSVNSSTMRGLGQLIKSLLPYAKDEAAFTELVSGAGALQRGMDLAMWYFGALGEFESSAN